MTPFSVLLWHLGLSLVTAIVVMVVTFVLGYRLRRYRGVDVAWGLTFAAIAIVTLLASTGYGGTWTRWIVTLTTVAWGLRLSVHIHSRSRGTGEDPRYAELLAKASGNRHWYALTRIHLLQAVVAWFVSIPVQVAQFQPDVTMWLFIGAAVWLFGFSFEAVGDRQLATFRASPDNKHKVLDSGLWRYTRHPNYFGDACVWWGLYLLACGSFAGAATILSPLVMTYFLAAKTGKPLLERHLSQSRPGYAAYVRRTSGFIPLPPKR